MRHLAQEEGIPEEVVWAGQRAHSRDKTERQSSWTLATPTWTHPAFWVLLVFRKVQWSPRDVSP